MDSHIQICKRIFQLDDTIIPKNLKDISNINLCKITGIKNNVQKLLRDNQTIPIIVKKPPNKEGLDRKAEAPWSAPTSASVLTVKLFFDFISRIETNLRG